MNFVEYLNNELNFVFETHYHAAFIIFMYGILSGGLIFIYVIGFSFLSRFFFNYIRKLLRRYFHGHKKTY